MSRTQVGGGKSGGARNTVSQVREVVSDGGHVPVDTRRILQKYISWRDFGNAEKGLAPEVTRIGCATPPTSLGPALTREACTDDIHSVTPNTWDKRTHVVPDGERFEDALFLAPKQDLSAVRVDLNRAHDAPSKQPSSENSSTSASEQCQLIHPTLQCKTHATPIIAAKRSRRSTPESMCVSGG
jgi:hypothetical protein